MAISRAGFENKIKDLEAALSTATKENAEMKMTLEKQEDSWKTRLTTAEQKLGESQEALQNITNWIGKMVKAIWGMFIKSLSYIPLSLQDKHCMLIIIFPFTRDQGSKLWWEMQKRNFATFWP